MSYAPAEAIDVLLVEDNPNDAEFAIRAFRKAPVSPKVLHLDDGAKALDYLFCADPWKDRGLAGVPKVILLDLKLPKIDGIEVLRRLKNDERTRRIPVVILSSSREPRDIEESYARAVNAYVVKPVNYQEFKDALLDLCRFWTQVNIPPAPRGC